MPESNLFISYINYDDHKSSTAKVYSPRTGDVIIYTLHLPEYIELTKDLIHFLNAEERSRSDRYFKEKDRNQFIICRSILKIILAAYTTLEAKNINLDYHFNKKPYLSSQILISQTCYQIFLTIMKFWLLKRLLIKKTLFTPLGLEKNPLLKD